jgi:serine protease Do
MIRGSREAAPLPLCARLLLTAALLGWAAGAAAADTKVVPQSAQQMELSFAPVVKTVAPAVVNIYARRLVRSQSASPLFDDPFFKRFFGEDFGFGMPRQRLQQSLGSGVIVSADGLVVTNNHVIENSDGITVALGDRREFEAKVVTADERTDLALLRIEPKDAVLPTLMLRDSDELEVGDLVLAIGNPFGVGQTVTSGIVSALARTQVGISDLGFFIQTDAAINPGNSGGALVGLDGKLVGINTAIFSRNGGSVGIGFAIPSNMVATVIDAAQNGGKLVRPWIGAAGQALTAELAEGFGLDRPGGVIVNKVYASGPAAKAGLEVGDVVLAINGREVVDPAGLRFRIATLKTGGTAELTVLRGTSRLELPVALQPAPEQPTRDVSLLDGEQPLAGATVMNLSPAVAEELGLDDQWDGGVVVSEVERGSYARRLGLARGDLLLQIGDQKIDNVKDLRAVLGDQPRRWRITIRRGDDVRTVVVD